MPQGYRPLSADHKMLVDTLATQMPHRLPGMMRVCLMLEDYETCTYITAKHFDKLPPRSAAGAPAQRPEAGLGHGPGSGRHAPAGARGRSARPQRPRTQQRALNRSRAQALLHLLPRIGILNWIPIFLSDNKSLAAGLRPDQ